MSNDDKLFLYTQITNSKLGSIECLLGDIAISLACLADVAEKVVDNK